MIHKKLTVTLPVYNAMPYLVEAVSSILRQSYEDFDFIIIDDGSTDNSLRYLKSIIDSRVKVFSQENSGLGSTLNKLVSISTTEYIARMDADDVSHPDRLKVQMEFLEMNSDVVLSGTGFYFMDNSGNHLKSFPVLTCHDDIMSRFYKKRFGLCHASIIFKKSTFLKIGGYRVQRQGEDLDFLIRMGEAGRLSNVNEHLYFYRQHENTVTTINRDKMHLGYSYAVECAKQRLNSETELSFEEFQSKWSRRSSIVRIAEYLEDLSEKFYRQGILRRMKNEKIFYYYLIVAALLRPHTVLERLLLRLKLFLKNTNRGT